MLEKNKPVEIGSKLRCFLKMDSYDRKPHGFTECPGIDNETFEQQLPVVGPEPSFISNPDMPHAFEKGFDP